MMSIPGMSLYFSHKPSHPMLYIAVLHGTQLQGLLGRMQPVAPFWTIMSIWNVMRIGDGEIQLPSQLHVHRNLLLPVVTEGM